ncbi:hypothetical protein Trydic_g5880 [Trypoxylus dichotomus]
MIAKNGSCRKKGTGRIGLPTVETEDDATNSEVCTFCVGKNRTAANGEKAECGRGRFPNELESRVSLQFFAKSKEAERRENRVYEESGFERSGKRVPNGVSPHSNVIEVCVGRTVTESQGKRSCYLLRWFYY